MVVQHNMQAANANRMLGITTGAQAKSTEKLSSGYKINRAADDAAGLAISEKMRSQVRGLDRASTNAQDGISVVQTAEGALNEVHSMLQRMNELSTQAANDTNTTQDRKQIQLEVDQLTSEIDRVSSTTQFNTMNLLDGSFSKKNLQVGSLSGQTIELNIGEMSAKGLGLSDGSATTATVSLTTDEVQKQYGALALTNGTASTTYMYFDHTPTTSERDTDGDGKSDTALAVDAGAGWYEVDADGKIAKGQALTLTDPQKKNEGFKNAKNGDKISLGADKKVTSAENHSKPATHPNSLSTDEISAKYGDMLYDGTGAALATGKSYVYYDAETIKTADFATGVTNKATTAGWYEIGTDGKIAADGATSANSSASVDIKTKDSTTPLVGKAGDKITIDGTTAGKIASASELVSGPVGSVGGLDVTTHDGAESAMDKVQSAIDKVSTQRANLGAVQNRLEHTIANLDNVSENTQSAESRIRDTDMAKEMVQYSKNNILAQAGQSMLAQANQSNQGVLSLLQ
ncbi:flagellin N-terminal helical domain-containing protein [Candidatus Weimeria sp. HCP3S3_B5]|uniref:flagellin N-terminal helical domain-containing protein n=1 Tax=Candidatus Weimeria sp. HCP3S3_B5 TaxID=3438871 RepID=UPI003F89DBB8